MHGGRDPYGALSQQDLQLLEALAPCVGFRTTLHMCNLFILITIDDVHPPPPLIIDAPYRVLVLGSSSKVVLVSPSWGVLIAICIGSLKTCVEKIVDLGQEVFIIRVTFIISMKRLYVSISYTAVAKILHHLIHVYTYCTSRTPILLVCEVYMGSCRISTINNMY